MYAREERVEMVRAPSLPAPWRVGDRVRVRGMVGVVIRIVRADVIDVACPDGMSYRIEGV